MGMGKDERKVKRDEEVTMKLKKYGWNLFFLLLLLVGLGFLFVGFTRHDRVAEKELPYYCMYDRKEEIDVSVVRGKDALVERVACKSRRAEENAVPIGYRSMVYWGYRGSIPFASSYALGEEEPKMLQARKDNYQRARTFQMFGREVPVEIFVVGLAGEILWHESYRLGSETGS